MAEQHDSTDAMQGYYDWQVTTLMLAYDLTDPIASAAGPDMGERRRRTVEEEVRRITLDLVPDLYKQDPSLDWPPELMMAITRTTLHRAAEIADVLS